MLAMLIATSIIATADLSPVKGAVFAKPGAPIKANLSGVSSACELVVLNADGKELERATAPAAGEIDLAALLPTLTKAQHAVRVQAIVGGAPEGSPLVIVPLTTRPTLRVMSDLRPDGKTKFTRIIGWGDQLLDPKNPAHAKEKESWAESDPSPISGFRIEQDRDVVFETTAGTIKFAMRPDQAPATARNFVDLADSGFYNGTIVHRVVPKGRNGKPFVIQGGDPTGTGDGGPGYDIPLEPSKFPHDFGVLSMARNDWPDSAGSQWFVALTREETARLDGQYCAFGYAVEGADALIAIEGGKIADEKTGRPEAPAKITRAFVQSAPPWTPGKGRPDAPVKRPASPAAPAAS